MCLKYKMITDKKNGRKKNDLHSVWNSSILLRWKKSAVHISWWCSFVLKYLRIVQHNWTSSTGKSDYLIKTKWEKNSAKHDRGSNVYCFNLKIIPEYVYAHRREFHCNYSQKKGASCENIPQTVHTMNEYCKKKIRFLLIVYIFLKLHIYKPNQHNNNSAIQHGLLR